MKKMKKLISLFLAAATVLSLTACNKNPAGTTAPSDGASGDGEKGNYSVTVQTVGKMPMKDIDVYIYDDETKANIVQIGKTDENGKVTFDLPKSDKYVIDLPQVPKGYSREESYSFSGNAALVTLSSSLIEGESMSGASFKLGDVMYNFEITTTDGTKIKLSDVLAEKKAVLLNFWFSTCGPCASEVPYMEEAYQMYKDDVEILAINPYAADNEDSVKAFKDRYNLSFPMAKVPDGWAEMAKTGYPTTYVIDRYGVVCLIEVGALTSLRPFTSIMEYFTADDYVQKLCDKGVASVISPVKPNCEMPSSEEIGNTINKGDIDITYRPETEGEDATYSWPFVITEKNGEPCIKPSNTNIEASFSIMYADVKLKKGQALGFDYLTSTELGKDILYVIVNDKPIFQISGINDPEKWQSAYPWVAQEDGTYEVAFVYNKDDSDNKGDDTVYIKNMRVVDKSEIDAETYLPNQAATPGEDKKFNYVDIVYNAKDNYYHVGSENGPLLLANLMYSSDFSKTSLWELASQGKLKDGDKDLAEDLLEFASYASNSAKQGYCTVTKELMELLQKIDKLIGFDDQDNKEWMKACMYYAAYGTDGKQLVDPIKGLAPFCAYTAKLGDNNIRYDGRGLMPKGLMCEFIPTKSGVYRVTSFSDSEGGTEGWIGDANNNKLAVYGTDIRTFNDPNNVCMYLYMEAGTPYYITVVFWDMFEAGDIPFKIEYVKPQYDVFRLASPGYFTYETDENGDVIGEGTTVAGGIDVVLGTDGFYYHDLGKDAHGKQIYGSKIYADFTGIGIFNLPIASVPKYNADGTVAKDENGKVIMIKGLLDTGAFDFRMTEYDLFVVQALRKNNNDQEATLEFLRKTWKDDFDHYYDLYKVDDVFDGIYHGTGKDESSVIRSYLNKMIKNPGADNDGCVAVDKELARVLWLLMDKYTFEGVENSWLKVCFYYDHLGPKA